MKRLLLLVVVSAVARSPVWADEAPPLPPGLTHEEETGVPALPPGLAGEEETGAPALPPGLGAPEGTETPMPPPEKTRLIERLPFALHGYWEVRAGVRTQPDPAQPDDATIAETRLQLETERAWKRAVFAYTGDVYLDGVLEQAEFDLRRAQVNWSPLKSLDLRIGRQVLTWGTGDLIFINDLFPKDWQSFFIGRDDEYLKAPSDALRLSWFSDAANLEFVYAPQFAPDRYITGERISYWSPLLGRRAGEDDELNTNPPSDWLKDDEFAWRVYRSVGSAELALYGYSGYWKSPGGMRLWPIQATFPKLSVYGASLRGALGKGIANIEMGYYDSRQDRDGDDPLINNSEFRLLLAYEQELAKELTGGFQYYLEHMMDYGAYRNTLPFIMDPRDRDRHVFTVRLTKLLMNQNLTLSLFAYYSPSDGDAYLRPKMKYKATDRWMLELGGNVFLGESDTTFFGQFEDNTNVYVGARYSF